MNKRANTLLFIAGATLVNLISMVVVFFVLLLIFGRLLAPIIPARLGQLLLPILFVASMVITYFVYQRLIRWLSGRIELTRYFEPIFRIRKKR